MKKLLLLGSICLFLCGRVVAQTSSLSSGLVLYLPFSGSAADASGRGNHGVLHGSPTLTTDAAGTPNSAYYFDGVSDYITVPDDTSLSPQLFSLCAKVFPTGYFGGLCHKNDIIGKSKPDWVTGQYCLRFDNNYKYAAPGGPVWTTDCTKFDTSDMVFNGYCYNAYPTTGYFAGTTPVRTNRWYCAVLTADASYIRMYVNGVLQYRYARGGTQGTNTEDVFIAKMNDPYGPYGYYFNGKLDEIRIYNRALTPAEIDEYCDAPAIPGTVNAGFNHSLTGCLTVQFSDLSTASPGPVTRWRWDFGDGDTSGMAGPVHEYASAGSYKVRQIVMDKDGNADTAEVMITLSGNPLVVAQPADTMICFNSDPLRLRATGAASYRWSPATGLSDSTSAAPVLTPGAQERYIVIGEDGFCFGADTIYVHRMPEVPVLVSPDTVSGCGSREIILEASGASEYRWFPPVGLSDDRSANPVLSIAGTFSYVLRGTDANGCTGYDTVSVIQFPAPNVHAFSNKHTFDCLHGDVQLSAIGAKTFSWDPAFYCDNPRSALTTVRPPGSTVFTVTGTNEYGCQASDTISVQYDGEARVIVPNAFTPNDDELNDYIRPIIVCDFDMKEFSIYNRWGGRIFTTSDPNERWTGNSKGVPCDSGVYFYLLKGKDSKGNDVLLKGTITLIR